MTRQDTEPATLNDTEPATSYETKMVLMRAEPEDHIEIDGHGEYEVVKRQQTFYGPVLYLSPADGDGANLKAYGDPRRQLVLSERVTDENGMVRGERPVGDAEAELVETKQYDMCACGEPLKSREHRRQAYLGVAEHG